MKIEGKTIIENSPQINERETRNEESGDQEERHTENGN